jgi:protocatechuate 4,5-dioxygenase, alpha chain
MLTRYPSTRLNATSIPGELALHCSAVELAGAYQGSSFNSAENRAAFLKDEEAYCRQYGLNDEQRAAVKSRSVLKMIEAGGNVYYLAKLAGIFGLNVQDIGAQQTGMSVEAFKSKLQSAGA